MCWQTSAKLCVFHTFVDARLGFPLKLFVEGFHVSPRGSMTWSCGKGGGVLKGYDRALISRSAKNYVPVYPLLSPHAEDSLLLRHVEVHQLLERVEVLVQIVSCTCALTVARRGAVALALPLARSKLATLQLDWRSGLYEPTSIPLPGPWCDESTTIEEVLDNSRTFDCVRCTIRTFLQRSYWTSPAPPASTYTNTHS